MDLSTRWIDLEGAVNMRDIGGLPTTDGGTTRFGRVLRSDNLQALTPADIHRLVSDIKVRHVVDLRTHAENGLEGPGPLTRVPEVTIHHLTLFAEGGRHTDVEAGGPGEYDADAVLPWQSREEVEVDRDRAVGFYLGYLYDRPDSVLAALRVLAKADGAALVHCAAGKDRTGTIIALALEVAGATRDAIIDDYVRTGERIERILARLRSSPTYADDLDMKSDHVHIPRAHTMRRFLEYVDEHHGGPLAWLAEQGWSEADTAALRASLRD